MVFDCPRPSASVPAPIKSPAASHNHLSQARCSTPSRRLARGGSRVNSHASGRSKNIYCLQKIFCIAKKYQILCLKIFTVNFSRSGLDLLSGHHSHHSSHSHHKMILAGDRDRAEKPSSFGVKSGVKKLFPLNRSITTIPEDFQTQSQDAEE